MRPAVLYLPDGARCEVADPAARAALADALAYRPSMVMRWQRHWYAALAALVLLLAVGAGACGGTCCRRRRKRLPPTFPRRSTQSIGASALNGLETKLLKPSPWATNDRRIGRPCWRDRAGAPRHPLRLLVRDAPLLGPNALALPDGTIVITDQMVRAYSARRR